MANIGRQKPLEVMTSHLSKAEIEERKASELKVEKLTKIPSCPAYLTVDQKKIFKKICKMLIDVNLLTSLDIDTIARYCVLQDTFIQLNKQINEDSSLLLNDKILNKQIKLSKEIQVLSNVLCLNPIARAKIVVNKVEEKKEESKFSKFLGCDDDE